MKTKADTYEWKFFKELDINSIHLNDARFMRSHFEENVLTAIEHEWRVPNRPLWTISDFTVEILPTLLRSSDVTYDFENDSDVSDFLKEIISNLLISGEDSISDLDLHEFELNRAKKEINELISWGKEKKFLIEQSSAEISFEEEEREWLKKLWNNVFEEINYLYTSYITEKNELVYAAKQQKTPFDGLNFAKQEKYFWENLELALLDLWMIQNVIRYKKWKHIAAPDYLQVKLWSVEENIVEQDLSINKELMYINQLHPAYDEIEEPTCLSSLILELTNLIQKESNLERKETNQMKLVERVPQITYEDLIFVNPLNSDPRLFFWWKTWNAEYLFYYGHGLIEKHFYQMVNNVIYLISNLENNTISENKITEITQKISWEWKQVLKLLGSYHRLLTDHFSVFRELFITKLEIWLRWASGAFSAWFPILDILTWLNTLDTANRWYLQEHLKYYPSEWQRLLNIAKEMADNNQTIESLWSSKNLDSVMELYDVMQKNIHRFRKAHAHITAKIIPDIYTWTWWFNIDEFLHWNIKHTKNKERK